VESLSDIVLLVDSKGVIEYINRVPGTASPADVIGRSVYEFMLPVYHTAARRTLRSAVESRRQLKYEAEGITPDGTILWYEMRVSPLFSPDGSVGALLAARDITIRKQIERDRHLAKEKLEQEVIQRTRALKRANRRLTRELAERRKTERALQESRRKLRKLSRYLEHVREQERIDLARDLHDQLGSTLTALKLNIHVLMNESPCPDSSHVDLRREINTRLDEAIRDIRSIIQKLRPPVLDDLGLVDAVRWLSGEMSGASGLAIKIEVEPRNLSIGGETATVLFRVFQELLTNIVRHARASRLHVRLAARKGGIFMTVRDDGKGMPDPDSLPDNAMGLMGIRERIKTLGGRIQMWNLKSGGSTFSIRVPRPSPSGEEAE